MPEPFRLSLGLYNSAGERVRQLFTGSAQAAPSNVQLSAGLLLTGLTQVSVELNAGALLGQGGAAWDGTNDGGQWVGNGTYYLKVETRDPYGSISSLILPLQVQAAQGAGRLQVFNSAGELVAQHSLAMSGSSLRLDASVLVVGTQADGSPLQALGITVNGAGGGSAAWAWDGRNQLGAPVEAGAYSVVLSCDEAGGSRVMQAQPLTVLRAPALTVPGGLVLAAPNPVQGAGAVVLRFEPAPGLKVSGQLFDLAGEAVDLGQADGAAGTLVFSRGGLAAGAYFARLSFLEGARVRRVARVKVAVLR